MTEARTIRNERAALAGSLWADTAHTVPDRPPLTGEAEVDVAVVGGGYTGLSAALHLAETGRRVILLEAQTPGWGASGRNGGQVNPGLKLDPDETIARFGPDLGRRMVGRTGASADLVFSLIERHGISCDASRCGWIRAAHSEKALRALESTRRQWSAHGAEIDPLDADEMERLLGARDYVGGVIDRRGGNLHPLNYALGLARAAETAGARICGESPVTAIEDGGDAVTVRTRQGRVTAARALVCTNGYTAELAQPLGRSVVPVTSVQVATEPLGDNIARSILPEGHSPSDTRRLLVYFRKDAQGRFLMGGRGAMGEAGIRRRQAALRDRAVRLYPQLADAEWRYAWGGDVALTPDHLPGLHLLSPNVAAGLGFNGRGVGMATVMGSILADWAKGMPEAELDFPVTAPRPIPFHRFRRLGVGTTVALFRLLDRFRL